MRTLLFFCAIILSNLTYGAIFYPGGSGGSGTGLPGTNQVVVYSDQYQTNYLTGIPSGFFSTNSIGYVQQIADSIITSNRLTGGTFGVTNGAAWMNRTLTVTNPTGGGNFLYGDANLTNFVQVVPAGVFVTNATGWILLSSDGIFWSNRLTATTGIITNNIMTMGAVNLTNTLNVGGVNVDSNMLWVGSAIYPTNNIYYQTNALLASTEVVDMRQPWQLLISATNVNILGYANITNGVLQSTSICFSNAPNTGNTNWAVSWVAGTKIFGDFGDTLTSSCVVTNQKVAWAEVRIIGGWSTNVLFFPQKN